MSAPEKKKTPTMLESGMLWSLFVGVAHCDGLSTCLNSRLMDSSTPARSICTICSPACRSNLLSPIAKLKGNEVTTGPTLISAQSAVGACLYTPPCNSRLHAFSSPSLRLCFSVSEVCSFGCCAVLGWSCCISASLILSALQSWMLASPDCI